MSYFKPHFTLTEHYGAISHLGSGSHTWSFILQAGSTKAWTWEINSAKSINDIMQRHRLLLNCLWGERRERGLSTWMAGFLSMCPRWFGWGRSPYHTSPKGLFHYCVTQVIMLTPSMSACTRGCDIIYIFFISIMHKPVGIKTRAVRWFSIWLLTIKMCQRNSREWKDKWQKAERSILHLF